MEQIHIETDNLILRPYTLADTSVVAKLAGDIRVAASTLNIPHPYSHHIASEWISSLENNWRERTGVSYAVILKATSSLVGTVSLVTISGEKAELGYWIGHEFWGNGFGTEAASALIHQAFEKLSITVIIAEHLSSNPASGKVMTKIGMVKIRNIDKPDRNGVISRLEVYKIDKCKQISG
jgi:RimJ/RimL family protein N-acetyltransferase